MLSSIMQVRTANAGDFAAILPMIRQQRLQRQESDPGRYELHPDAEVRFNRWLGTVAQDPRAVALVAEADDRVIGFLMATIEHDVPIYRIDEFALVREWWVDEPYQGQDVGAQLIRQAKAILKKARVQQIRVPTAADDNEARSLLKRCGFRAATTEMVTEL